MMAPLPYGRQVIEDDDIAAVTAVLRSDFLTTGPTVRAFEAAFAEAVGAPHAVACSSATAGLHLACLAAGIGRGDKVVVPSITFLASANAATYAGAEVVFADVDPDTGLMTPETLEEALARAGGPVKAVFPVQLAGQLESPVAIAEVAARHGAIVIEDACHALGASYRAPGGERRLGACHDASMAVFSFHPVKTIAMGEGGAVTTRDPVLAERLARLVSHGMHKDPAGFLNPEFAFDVDGTPNPWYYEMPEPGYNYRASDIHCALGLSQLRKLDRFLARRAALVALYDRMLRPLAPVIRPIRRVNGCTPAWHLYATSIDFEALGTTRGQYMKALLACGVGTQVHYIPVHRQPFYRARSGDVQLPGADRYYSRALSLPLFPSMSDADAERVVRTLVECLPPSTTDRFIPGPPS